MLPSETVNTSRCLVEISYKKLIADVGSNNRLVEGLSCTIRPQYSDVLILGDFNFLKVKFDTYVYLRGEDST